MSREEGPTSSGVAAILLGLVLLVFGLLFVYFSLTARPGIVDPRALTPVGVAIALIGGLMIFIRKA